MTASTDLPRQPISDVGCGRGAPLWLRNRWRGSRYLLALLRAHIVVAQHRCQGR